MSIEVRNPSTLDDYIAAVDVMTTAFLERPNVERVAEQVQDQWRPDRTWVAWDGPRACGTFGSWATELTLPGGAVLPAAAVAGVTVLPTHRRRGILRRMADTAHRAAVDAAEPLAILYASEYPIYGRFGYGPATRSAMVTVSPKETTVPGVASGSVELAPLCAATRDAVRAVFDAARLRLAGEVSRSDVAWDVATGLQADAFDEHPWAGFIALHRGVDGAVDGYARYKTEQKWDRGPIGEIELADLHALTDAAYADLWRFLLSVDLVTVVKARNRPLDEALPWLLANARAADIGTVRDRLWVRIFDVPRALEARAYERPGALTLEVVDDDAWGGTRRWRLEAAAGGAACRPTTASPDLTLPVAALGAAYLGGSRLGHVVRMTGADEHREGALAEADALFRTAAEPWCSTFF